MIHRDEHKHAQGDTIRLRNGVIFDIFNPRATDVDVRDIAASLSKICRYAGRTKMFYSVAEHAMLMAQKSLVLGRSPYEALQALHHDDAEAYTGDLVKPLKNRLPDYKAIEAEIEKVVFAKLMLPFPLADWIHDMDSQILIDETAQCFERYEISPEETPLGVCITFLRPELAEEMFLNTHYYLMRRMGHSL